MATGGNVSGVRATDAWVLCEIPRPLSASMQRPLKRKLDAYLGRVCVSTDNPVTMRRAADAFFDRVIANGSSASVYVAPLEMP
jgi:hypothetical protein